MSTFFPTSVVRERLPLEFQWAVHLAFFAMSGFLGASVVAGQLEPYGAFQSVGLGSGTPDRGFQVLLLVTNMLLTMGYLDYTSRVRELGWVEQVNWGLARLMIVGFLQMIHLALVWPLKMMDPYTLVALYGWACVFSAVAVLTIGMGYWVSVLQNASADPLVQGPPTSGLAITWYVAVAATGLCVLVAFVFPQECAYVFTLLRPGPGLFG